MAGFAINTVAHEIAIRPAELARWAEENGFEALYFGEHSHIPVDSHIPASIFPDGFPDWYKEFYDPFVSLAAAATATSRLKIGSAVCLVAQHDTIQLAKTAATLDRISAGRLLLGIGGGWNREEMANHGVSFADRWSVVREKVLAMREIWTHDEAEFHGDFVDFGCLWCWPKPARSGGPPVIMGAGSPATPARIAEYCDGWMPIDGTCDLERGLAEIRTAMQRTERRFEDLDLCVITGHSAEGDDRRVAALLEMGFQRVSFFLAPAPPEIQWPILQALAETTHRFAAAALAPVAAEATEHGQRHPERLRHR